MISSNCESEISIQVVHGIAQITAQDWDALSAELPFQSYAWYEFGERVMADCEPIYLLAYQKEQLVGRASLWIIRNEPLPRYVGHWRILLRPALRKWPLLICRSPLSYSPGLVVQTDISNRSSILSALAEAALRVGRQNNCSFLIFDYLENMELHEWPKGFSKMSMSDPGTVMRSTWADFNEYLAHGNKKDRQHYKRTMHETEKLNIKVTQHSSAENIEELLPLIREMEQQHGAPENPWVANMLRHMEMAHGVLLTANADGRLVGCGLLLEDNNTQMTSALGRLADQPYVYLRLVYESIKVALEHKLEFLRWGSGAYEIKKKLGFELENNTMLAFIPIRPLMQKIFKV